MSRLPPGPRAALAPLAARLLAELRRVRKNPADVGAIHDARVAARRLSAAGEIWLEAGKPLDRLQGRLEKCLRRLGRVRNADVALEFLADGPAPEAAARTALSKGLRRKLKFRRKQLAAWLTVQRFKRLKSTLSRAIPEARDGAEPPGPRTLGRQLQTVLGLSIRGRPMADPAKAHELRRKIRILRYQQESIAAAYSENDTAALRDLFIHLQDAAGGWHDRFQLDRLAAAIEQKPKYRRAAGLLRRRLASEMKEASARFVEALQNLNRLKAILLGQAGRA
ncbi:MAG: hypothetical protein FD180_337 [Planctomycetota bacterium]|nr:MAG: hypothetical protein FD180_337 [Planctomycetota bacterium]